MQKMRGTVGVLFRGGADAARVTVYANAAADFEFKLIVPERDGDPLLQAALCYRLLQLDYDAVVLYPEDANNLGGRIRGALRHRPILDVGAKTQPSLVSDVPGYRPVPIPRRTGLDEEVQIVLDALRAGL